MLRNGKYYVAVGNNTQLQVTKREHERIRMVYNQPLLEAKPEDEKAYTWIDDDSVVTFEFVPRGTPTTNKDAVFYWEDEDGVFYCKGGGLIGIGKTLEEAQDNYYEDFYG